MTDHRELGRSLNGLVWQLLARTDRTADDDARMVDAAHASQYHWREAGGPTTARPTWPTWSWSAGPITGGVHEGGWRLTRGSDGGFTATPPYRRPRAAA